MRSDFSQDDQFIRVAELGEILAAGVIRGRMKKSSQISPISGENLLDISPAESGHGVGSSEDDR